MTTQVHASETVTTGKISSPQIPSYDFKTQESFRASNDRLSAMPTFTAEENTFTRFR